MILVIFLPMFFMIFMVFFPLFWALAICGCWFLPLTKFSKVLISVLIVAMLCGGIAFLFFDKESRFFSFLFACGFISLPVFLRYFWRSQESYEKYYHIIHTNPLTQNNLKRRAISLFSIGLLGTFMSLWQVEVPQKVVVNLLSVKLEIVDTNFTYLENPIKNFGRKDNLKFEYIEMKEFLNFAYTRNNIYACDEIDCKGNKKYIGYVVTPWSQRSTLMCFMNTAGRCLGTVSKDYNAKEEILKYIKRGKNE